MKKSISKQYKKNNLQSYNKFSWYDNCMQKNTLSVVLSYEWSLWSKFLGKILLITGPSSSGKSTLVYKIVEKLPNCKTINRKKLLFSFTSSNELQEYFAVLLEEATITLGEKISNLKQLYRVNVIGLPTMTRNKIEALKDRATEIVQGQDFKSFKLATIFNLYYTQMQQYIFSGENIILDEGLIESETAYNLFKYYCNYYPNIRRVLLFNTLEETIEKCTIRNKQFIKLLDGYPSLDALEYELEKLETDTGNSVNTLRSYKFILENYMEYYKFRNYVTVNDIVLDEVKDEELRIIINNAEQKQLSLLKICSNKGYKVDISKDFINSKLVLAEICKGKKTYIISTINPEYIIQASEIKTKDLLENVDFLFFLLKDILPWLGISYSDQVINLLDYQLIEASQEMKLLGAQDQTDAMLL